jgi:hypothetical protein
MPPRQVAVLGHMRRRADGLEELRLVREQVPHGGELPEGDLHVSPREEFVQQCLRGRGE